MKLIILTFSILASITIYSCHYTPPKSVYIETDCLRISSFTKNCNGVIEFLVNETVKDFRNSYQLIEITQQNDSVVTIKTFVVKNKVKKVSGNMGAFNLNKHLINSHIDDFIFLAYQKAFGPCN